MSNRMPMSLFAILAIYLGLLAGGAHVTRVAGAGPRAETATTAIVAHPSDERPAPPQVARVSVEVGPGGAQGG